ncbi:gamma-glutamylcyclotransferase family protein [Clostridium sp. DJ247]|uniref:gamma-glutamylcyclotransferase family protein n=1 Tax=Clostridium sp. DJ247 TaxID=2726188 RepID=UPI001626F8A5|nr:gamma-glutamylcyclotransferase family protein [Clostridium sp. DJ247]MBC2581329.1 gamma-glutamylcyclotransferase [Clostridium sp. DJ247]
MLYFAYGSNLNRLQMKKRCPDSVPLARVRLKGYKLVFNKYADIIESKEDIVYGAVYKVSNRDIKNLDIYEEYPRLYKKIDIIVEDDEGKSYNAFVYIMNEKGKVKPAESYYNIIVQGYKHWNLSLESLENAF